MTEEEIQFIAQARIDLNADMRNTNHFGGNALDNQLAGVRAEVWFADRYGLAYDQIRAPRRGSDGGVDFTVHFNSVPLTFDVKAKTELAKDDDLLVKVEKFKHGRCADYFVLVRCNGTRIRFIGWEDTRLVHCSPVEQRYVPTHVRPRRELRQLWALDVLMRRRDRTELRA